MNAREQFIQLYDDLKREEYRNLCDKLQERYLARFDTLRRSFGRKLRPPVLSFLYSCLLKFYDFSEPFIYRDIEGSLSLTVRQTLERRLDPYIRLALELGFFKKAGAPDEADKDFDKAVEKLDKRDDDAVEEFKNRFKEIGTEFELTKVSKKLIHYYNKKIAEMDEELDKKLAKVAKKLESDADDKPDISKKGQDDKIDYEKVLGHRVFTQLVPKIKIMFRKESKDHDQIRRNKIKQKTVSKYEGNPLDGKFHLSVIETAVTAAMHQFLDENPDFVRNWKGRYVTLVRKGNKGELKKQKITPRYIIKNLVQKLEKCFETSDQVQRNDLLSYAVSKYGSPKYHKHYLSVLVTRSINQFLEDHTGQFRKAGSLLNRYVIRIK